MWIELIGFDLHLNDYGVGRLCENAGFVPKVVTLLLSDPEFVHGHNDRLDRVLGPSICSYGGHPCNEERQRQSWKSRDVIGLTGSLQKAGIEVFFTHFDSPVSGWLKKHPELRFLDRCGRRTEFISPYKSLASGQLYRDFYLPLVAKVVRDYGFDGYHAGDGFAHPRIPIYEGDFSDDTIAQYLDWSGDGFPRHIAHPAGDETQLVKARADWIWQERRLNWIGFHRARTLEFWVQASSILHAEDKKLIFNTCWTRDPFEALYRYGVDYRALTDAGVDAFLAESAAAAHEYGGDLPYGEANGVDWDPTQMIPRFSTKLDLLRATAPKAKIIFMNGIKDTNEAWNGIRHAPTNVESEMLSHTSLFSIDNSGNFQPTTDGVISVLSDGLANHEWKWIKGRWDLGYSLRPEGILGAAIYWSDTYRETLLEDYTSCRRCPFDRIIWHLRAAGAPLLATVRSENLSQWNGPLVVIHPHLLPLSEWQTLLKRRNASLIAIGGPAPAVSKTRIHFQYCKGADAFEVSIYHWKGKKPKPVKFGRASSFIAEDARDPHQWLVDLPTRSIPHSVFQHIADWIVGMANGIRVLQNSGDIRAWGYEIGQGGLRVYVRNNSFYYRTAEIDTGRLCGKITTLTAFPGNPVTPDGSIFRFKMAGKSMAIFQLSPSS